jgi:hypothetical protein
MEWWFLEWVLRMIRTVAFHLYMECICSFEALRRELQCGGFIKRLWPLYETQIVRVLYRASHDSTYCGHSDYDCIMGENNALLCKKNSNAKHAKNIRDNSEDSLIEITLSRGSLHYACYNISRYRACIMRRQWGNAIQSTRVLQTRQQISTSFPENRESRTAKFENGRTPCGSPWYTKAVFLFPIAVLFLENNSRIE